MPSPKCPEQQHSIRYYTRLCLGGAGVLLSTGDIQDLKLVKSACIETALPSLVGWDHALKPMPSDVHTALVNQVSLCSSAVPACIPPRDTTTKNLSKKIRYPKPKKDKHIKSKTPHNLYKAAFHRTPLKRRFLQGGEKCLFFVFKKQGKLTHVYSLLLATMADNAAA